MEKGKVKWHAAAKERAKQREARDKALAEVERAKERAKAEAEEEVVRYPPPPRGGQRIPTPIPEMPAFHTLPQMRRFVSTLAPQRHSLLTPYCSCCFQTLPASVFELRK